MQKISCFLLLGLLLSVAGIAQTIPAPQVWLRGDQGKVTPLLWSDQSGHKLNANALTGEGPAEEGVLNFNRSLQFDGENDYMMIPYNLESLQSLTIFTVFQSTDTTERGLWAAEQTVSRKLFLSTRRVAGPDDGLDGYGKNEILPVLNTVIQSWKEQIAVGEGTYLALGSSGKEQDSIKSFQGSIAEIMIFDKVLSFMERVQVQTYLSVKYGIALKEGNYVSAAEDVLWKAEENKEFSHRIHGLGRDDAFRLYQKQSKSAFDTSSLLLLSAGPPAPSNALNTSYFGNGDFLIMGDNGQLLLDKPGEGENARLSVLERKWLMSVSGKSASQIPAQLTLDLSQLPPDSLGYWLVIDRSGKADFSIDRLEYILADSISADSIAYFKKINWDTDGSGKDVFSFARAQQLLALVTDLHHPDCDSLTAGRATFQVIGGKAPFKYSLENPKAEISRSWEGADSTRQVDLKAGAYTLKVTGADGHEVDRVFALTLPNTLPLQLGKDQILAEGGEITLDASEFIPDSIPVTYQWESSYGFRSNDPQINVRETGIYKVTVSNAEGCSFTDEIIISGSAAQRFVVFPNPVKSGTEFNISISLEDPGSVNLKIFNLGGLLLQEFQGGNTAEYHFKGNLKDPGMYMAVLKTAKGMEAIRFLVH